MNQTMKILVPVAIISSLATMMQCSNPDEPPLRWESKVQVPVSNKNFYLKKEFDNIFDLDSMSFIDRHPAEKDSGDTMIFSYQRSSNDTFETHEESIKNQRFVALIGPIPIGNITPTTVPANLSNNAGTFTITSTLPLDSIYSVKFYDTVTNKLPVVLTNATTATLTDVIISTTTLGSDTIETILPNTTDTAWLPVYGKQCGNSVNYTLSYTKGAGSGTLTVRFDPNGLKASSIKADDHIVKFNFNYKHPYEITDTLDLDYVDIATGKFIYTVQNYTGVPLTFKGDHEHIWDKDFCERRAITTISGLSSLTHDDSISFYSGKFNGTQLTSDGSQTSVEIPVAPHTEMQLVPKDLASKRLFAQWNTALKKSVTMVSYNLRTPVPQENNVIDTVTLSSSDSVVFSIQTPSFKFKEFLGTVMEEYNRSGDTQKIFIDVPWNQSAQDSLRGRFILKNVAGDVYVKPDMAKNAFINTMNIQFVVFSPESLSIKDSSNTVFSNVITDSTFFRSIDLTNVTNEFPDTIYVTAKIKIPVGTRMKAVNDLMSNDPDFDKYIGRMKINLHTNYFLNSDLDWEVKDTVKMDLGSGKFKVPEELRYIRKLEQRQCTFFTKIKNESNLNMILYALLAPKAKMKALDSIDGNKLTVMINNPDSAEAHGFVNFIDGVFIPKRDSTSLDTVVWDHDELEKIVTSDSCSWRWQLRFVPNSRDALKDVDYLQINSSLRIEGVNNMDSLMLW